MTRRESHSAPTQRPDETDLNFIVRVSDYLAEPQRRRLGTKTALQVKQAAARLQQ